MRTACHPDASELSERELAHGLAQVSGLLGRAGSADMREVLRRGSAGEEVAELALQVYLQTRMALV